MLGNFSCVLSSADLFFSTVFFLWKNHLGIPEESISLDPDPARPIVGLICPGGVLSFFLHT